MYNTKTVIINGGLSLGIASYIINLSVSSKPKRRQCNHKQTTKN